MPAALVTTPESLSLMLSRENAGEELAHARWSSWTNGTSCSATSAACRRSWGRTPARAGVRAPGWGCPPPSAISRMPTMLGRDAPG